jgi:hypothetical protein
VELAVVAAQVLFPDGRRHSSSGGVHRTACTEEGTNNVIVLGPNGIRHLDDDQVDGTDPLTVFGPHTADHLRRTSSFGDCPDLLINSLYDPDTDGGATSKG